MRLPTLLSMLASIPLCGADLVTNGGFESGLSGWQGAGTVVTANPHSGTSCIQVVDQSTTSSLALSGAALMTVGQGARYRCSVWVRAAVANQRVEVNLSLYRADGSFIPNQGQDVSTYVGTGWTQMSFEGRMLAPGAVAVGIALRPQPWTPDGAGMGTAWFDDVSLVVIPEPAPSGHPLSGIMGGPGLWVAPPEEKVGRTAVLPAGRSPVSSISFSAARNEFEPRQLVLVPTTADSLVSATVSAGAGPGGAVLPAAAFRLREVAYVTVTTPTDHLATTGPRPDPLPDLVTPLALVAGRNQPLWLTVRAPMDAVAGRYTGTLTLRYASGSVQTVPWDLTVRPFALPASTRMRGSYLHAMHLIDAQHHLGGNSSLRRQVHRLFLQDFAAHRIPAGDVIGDDRFVVSYPNLGWRLEALVADPAAPTSGNRVIQVVDSSTTAAQGVRQSGRITVTPGVSYQLTWRARTQGVRSAAITVSQLDAAGAWRSGLNLDTAISGNGSWQAGSLSIPGSAIAAGTSFVQIQLWAVPWSADGAGTGTTWFDDLSLRAVGSATELVANGTAQTGARDAVPELDFTAFDAAAAYALDQLGLGSLWVQLPDFASGAMGQNTRPSLLGFAWGSADYERIYVQILAKLEAHLAAKGWLEKAHVYWADEPLTTDYAFVAQGMDLVKRGAPRLRRLLTNPYVPQLAGKVDIWVPLTDDWDPSAAVARQAVGEQMWWYVATGPKAPYANNFIDHPGIEQRIRPWMAWRAGVTGELYWNINWSAPGQDPWTDPGSYSDADGSNWGNGDGRLIYPPRDWMTNVSARVSGPVPSQRWELLREGAEDYDVLSMLREATDRLTAAGGSAALVSSARAMLIVPDNLAISPMQFTQDPEVVQARRAAVDAKLAEVWSALGLPAGPSGSDFVAPAMPVAPVVSPVGSPTPVVTGLTEPGALVRIRDGGRQVAMVLAGSDGRWSWTASPALALGAHAMSVIVADAAGNLSSISPATTHTVTAGPVWSGADIGMVGVAGSAVWNGSTVTVRGAGADMWGTTDAGFFDYQTLTGDGSITAKVSSFTGWTAGNAKACLMIRQDLTSGSVNARSLVTGSWGTRFHYRAVANGTTGSVTGSSTAAAPIWLRLERVGPVLTGYTSADGISWTKTGSTNIPNLPAQVLIGPAVTSVSTTQAATAVFEQVAVVRAPSTGG